MPPKSKSGKYGNIGVEFRIDGQVAAVLLLQGLTKLPWPRDVLLHAVELGNKLYKHRNAGGKIVLIAKDGTKEELELL